MKGLNYCVSTDALQINLRSPECTLADVTKSLLMGGAKEFAIFNHLEICIHVNYYVGERCLPEWKQLMRALSTALPQLETLQIKTIKPAMMFPLNQIGNPPVYEAFFPGRVLNLFLETFPGITTLKLQGLQLTKSSTPCNILLAQSLFGNSSLQHFGFRYCSFAKPTSNESPLEAHQDYESMDPILEALATIPTLESISIRVREGGQTVPSTTLETWARNCKRLQKVVVSGMTCSLPTVSTTTRFEKLEKIQIALPDFKMETGKAVSQWLLKSTTLKSLVLHLPWFRDNKKSTAEQHKELQQFQDSIAESIPRNLQQLHIVCRGMPPPSSNKFCVESFRKALQVKPSLTHLCLPQCGELDHQIDFWLQVNQSGIRSLLASSPQRPRKQQQPLEQAWELLDTTNQADEDLRFSMMYYFLREKPCLIRY